MKKEDDLALLNELERMNSERSQGEWIYVSNATVIVAESPVKYRVVATCSDKEVEAAENDAAQEYGDAIVRAGCHDMAFIAFAANAMSRLVSLARDGLELRSATPPERAP